MKRFIPIVCLFFIFGINYAEDCYQVLWKGGQMVYALPYELLDSVMIDRSGELSLTIVIPRSIQPAHAPMPVSARQIDTLYIYDNALTLQPMDSVVNWQTFPVYLPTTIQSVQQ